MRLGSLFVLLGSAAAALPQPADPAKLPLPARVVSSDQTTVGAAAAELARQAHVAVSVPPDAAGTACPAVKAVPFWDALEAEWERQLPDLHRDFTARVDAHMQETDAEIKQAARDIIQRLEDQPAILNTLRTTGTFTGVDTLVARVDTTDAGGTMQVDTTYRYDTLWVAGTGGVAKLGPLQDPGTPDGRVDLLFHERAFWLYLTGHRQGDLRRLIRDCSGGAGTAFAFMCVTRRFKAWPVSQASTFRPTSAW